MKLKKFSLKYYPFLEIIGCEAEVVSSENFYNVGIKGIIIDETKMFLNISGKLIKKENSIFLITFPDGTKALISGNLLLGRPEERTKHATEVEKYAKRSFRIQGSGNKLWR